MTANTEHFSLPTSSQPTPIHAVGQASSPTLTKVRKQLSNTCRKLVIFLFVLFLFNTLTSTASLAGVKLDTFACIAASEADAPEDADEEEEPEDEEEEDCD